MSQISGSLCINEYISFVQVSLYLQRCRVREVSVINQCHDMQQIHADGSSTVPCNIGECY